MDIRDIPLFCKAAVGPFEEELLFKDDRVELWVSRKITVPYYGSNKTPIHYGKFTIVIYSLTTGTRLQVDSYASSILNIYDSMDNFLEKFSSLNRLMAYMLKAYYKNRTRNIQQYKDTIHNYERDLPSIEMAMSCIESLKPPRGKKNANSTS